MLFVACNIDLLLYMDARKRVILLLNRVEK